MPPTTIAFMKTLVHHNMSYKTQTSIFYTFRDIDKNPFTTPYSHVPMYSTSKKQENEMLGKS